MRETHEETAAASISDGLVQGSFPVLEPNEYRAFDMTPLVVVTAPSPMAGLPLQVAIALRIIRSPRSNQFLSIFIEQETANGCDSWHSPMGHDCVGRLTAVTTAM
jgi:hypothetical protein